MQAVDRSSTPTRILSGMPEMTTIKVSRELRDRLAERATRQGTTLAGVIASSLDDLDERAFWDQVRAHHAGLSEDQRRRWATDPTLADNLADPGDDALAEDQW